VPRILPALLEAQQLTSRASKVGFDWENAQGVLDKLAEESTEVKVALEAGDRVHLEEEIGDLLFVCVNLARFLDFDAELALKKANRKFTARFREMERTALHRGERLDSFSAGELEVLWEREKGKTSKAKSVR
jgi:uncharacterized protein YabN with tetrapyrrole methylase and pyrophosphatase domain